MIKEDIRGAAAFIQGYAAREGLGITLIINQMVAERPRAIANALVCLKFLILLKIPIVVAVSE
jgi:hypothetical protein